VPKLTGIEKISKKASKGDDDEGAGKSKSPKKGKGKAKQLDS